MIFFLDLNFVDDSNYFWFIVRCLTPYACIKDLRYDIKIEFKMKEWIRVGYTHTIIYTCNEIYIR